jgi:hypothetical protein
MGLTNSDGMSPADVAAVMGNNDGFGNGNGAWWILILFLFAAFGWGNGGYGNGGGNGVDAYVQRGFDQTAVMSGINGLTTAVANGFANAEVSRCNGQTNILQALNSNQMAMTQGMNTLAFGLQGASNQNAMGIADLKFTVAQEACADRNAISDALRDVIANNTANTQAILDKMCQQEIDALKTQNANLQTQLNMMNLAQSQTAQTAQLLADNANQTSTLEQYLAPVPRPAYIVANPNGCNCGNNFGCGCGSYN